MFTHDNGHQLWRLKDDNQNASSCTASTALLTPETTNLLDPTAAAVVVRWSPPNSFVYALLSLLRRGLFGKGSHLAVITIRLLQIWLLSNEQEEEEEKSIGLKIPVSSVLSAENNNSGSNKIRAAIKIQLTCTWSCVFGFQFPPKVCGGGREWIISSLSVVKFLTIIERWIFD